MGTNTVNIAEKLSLFSTHWDPKIVGSLNGQYVKLVKFKHIYRYSSLFSHPTPTVKRLYLRTDDPEGTAVTAIDESIRQFVAYTLQFVEFTMGYAEKSLGSFATSSATNRSMLHTNVVEIVEQASKGYFHNPAHNNSADECPG